MTLVQKEPKYIKIGSTDAKKVYLGSTQVRPRPVNFATQGPSPDGFHVPLQSEWGGLYTTMSSVGASGSSNRKNYLHLPYAGYRDYSNSNVSDQNSKGYYWSSSPYTNSYPYYGYDLFINDNNCNYNDANSNSYGYSIRCFKNEFAVPSSSWTVIKGTLGGAGIFRNQTDGIISITTNGSTGYTIMDKNLGATTVYNSGNTLNQNNCGKYYQRGNNYGFNRTGSVTTSSSRVNAGSYGPGNYYSSDKFITTSSYPYGWDTSSNGNLRGGEDGNVPV